jgi:hypothetical protein
MIVGYRLADYDTPVSPTPSARGGRYHHAGGPPAHYWSAHPHTPWAESFRWSGIREPELVRSLRRRLWAARIFADPMPITFENASTYGVTPQALVDDDHTACQALADALRTQGVPAIRVPSAALPGTDNIVLLDDRIAVDYLDTPVDTLDLPTAIAADHAIGQAELLPLVRHFGDDHAGLHAHQGGAEHRYDQPHAPGVGN